MKDSVVRLVVLALAFGAAGAGLPRAQSSQGQPGGAAPAEKNPHVAEIEKAISGQESKPAEEVFKNIRILKGMSASRVLRVMETGFSKALGVECVRCHAAGQWDSDEKESKEISRKMWQLQANINKELEESIGHGTVNCTSCHRGQIRPALNMPVAKP